MVRGEVYQSVLMQGGIELGVTQFYPAEHTVEWHFPMLSVNPQIVRGNRLLKEGGWGFTPDLAWMNVQTMTTYMLGLQRKQSIPVQSGLLSQLFPTLFASGTDDGCTYMAYLNATIFRPCCDIHDACYETQSPQCTMSSWWSWGRIACDSCNFFAYVCFATWGKGGHVMYRMG